MKELKQLKEYEYFRTDNGVLYCGDALDILPLIDENSIDLVVTSPPYNFGISYDIYKDKLDWKDYYEWCMKWNKELYRLIKRDGRYCLNHYFACGNMRDGRHTPLMDLNYRLVNEIGFKHHSLAIWQDITLVNKTAWGSWRSASAPYINSPYEGILILYKELWKKQNKGISDISSDEFANLCRGNWNLGTDHNNDHPAPFPISLPISCIRLLSYVGDTILDLFMGSGSTVLAAEKTKRKWIGLELSPAYCEQTKKRVELYTKQMRMFDNVK
jgi:site-specific DNA-methyltransferase (adenine-specific)